MQFRTTINKIFNKFSTSHVSLMVILCALVITVVSYPRTTNAGFFSFFSDSTSDKASAKSIEIPNNATSQKMIVLQAPVNSNPNSIDLDSNPLVIGNTLVAEIGPSGTVSEVDSLENSTQISLYVVREGDTLSKIADMFDVSTNTIIWANGLSRNPVLQKDQKLIILPISGIKYTVKKGDTIKGIVLRHKSDLDEVLLYNDLTLSSVLSIGDTIIIPDAEPTATPASKVIAKKTVDSNAVYNANGPFYPGYYIRPIDNGYKSQGLHGYNAVDLAAPAGTAIHAAADGTVLRSVFGGWHGGYGNYVIISHSNGTQTLYAHTLKNFVSVGDYVKQGQLIAKVGSTGKSTGPHVHFEIRGAKNPF